LSSSFLPPILALAAADAAATSQTTKVNKQDQQGPDRERLVKDLQAMFSVKNKGFLFDPFFYLLVFQV
jgi:hypothetical protein